MAIVSTSSTEMCPYTWTNIALEYDTPQSWLWLWQDIGQARVVWSSLNHLYSGQELNYCWVVDWRIAWCNITLISYKKQLLQLNYHTTKLGHNFTDHIQQTKIFHFKDGKLRSSYSLRILTADDPVTLGDVASAAMTFARFAPGTLLQS